MLRRQGPDTADFITIADAAKLFGVSLPMLRHGDESGTFSVRSHPINSYRMHARDDVMRPWKQIVVGESVA